MSARRRHDANQLDEAVVGPRYSLTGKHSLSVRARLDSKNGREGRRITDNIQQGKLRAPVVSIARQSGANASDYPQRGLAAVVCRNSVEFGENLRVRGIPNAGWA